jgi:hypothetical protein
MGWRRNLLLVVMQGALSIMLWWRAGAAGDRR